MENVRDESDYENCVADVIIHEVPHSESPRSNIGLLKKKEEMHIYTNQVMEIEEAAIESITVEVEAEVGANESITVEMEPEETLKEHLVVLDKRECQDIMNRPEDLPEYSRLIIGRDDLFKTFDDNQKSTDRTMKTKWAAFYEKMVKSENEMSRSLWMWRTIFIILVVTLALLLYFTHRPVQNHYHIYH